MVCHYCHTEQMVRNMTAHWHRAKGGRKTEWQQFCFLQASSTLTATGGEPFVKAKKSDFKNDLEEHSTDHLQRLCLRYDLSTLQGIEIIYSWKMELITYTLYIHDISPQRKAYKLNNDNDSSSDTLCSFQLFWKKSGCPSSRHCRAYWNHLFMEMELISYIW